MKTQAETDQIVENNIAMLKAWKEKTGGSADSLTKRDAFAIAALPAAMHALADATRVTGDTSNYTPQTMAEFSYEIADAMLKERSK